MNHGDPQGPGREPDRTPDNEPPSQPEPRPEPEPPPGPQPQPAPRPGFPGLDTPDRRLAGCLLLALVVVAVTLGGLRLLLDHRRLSLGWWA